MRISVWTGIISEPQAYNVQTPERSQTMNNNLNFFAPCPGIEV